jgi:hypothetical protein
VTSAPVGTPFETTITRSIPSQLNVLKLAVRLTGMVDESRVVTLSALPYLVRWMAVDLRLHHIDVL